MKPKSIYILCLLMGIVLVGCNMPKGSGNLTEQQILQTAARQMVEAEFTQTAVLSMTAAGQNQQQVTQTETPLALLPSPTYSHTPVIYVTSPPPPCNWAAFISDITIPDNSQIMAGSTFRKIWRLQNLGSCTWTSGYRLTYSHGDRMSAPDNLSITTGSVSPGGLLDVAVDLVAPSTPGTYQGNFMLRSPDGYVFGIGGAANQSFWVKIVVVNTNTDTPTVTLTPSITPTHTFTPTNTNTPLPPNFVLSYDNVHNCGGTPYATTRVDNIGGVAFESVQITIEDLTAVVVLYGPGTNNSPFLGSSGDCPPQASALAPGGAAYIAANIAGYISGNTARETLTMCTQDGLGGDCITKSVDFVLP
jgi:hypothetical protein